jgi:hypothetical protein
MKPESNQEPKRKKPYLKPELTQVSLRPEEAVLGACKRTGRSGPGQGNCLSPAPCSSNGS